MEENGFLLIVQFVNVDQFLVVLFFFSFTLRALAGGGSLITLPALIMAGLPADVANGTNRVGILAASATATRRYQREGMYDQAFDRWTWTAACLGAVAGSWVSIELDEVLLRQVIGVAMLLMLGVLMTEPKVWLEGKAQAAPVWARALGFFFIGAGVSIGAGLPGWFTLLETIEDQLKPAGAPRTLGHETGWDPTAMADRLDQRCSGAAARGGSLKERIAKLVDRNVPSLLMCLLAQMPRVNMVIS